MAADDILIPFQLESSSYRGRVIKLGPVLDQILQPHGYPEPVAHLTGELAVLAALLSFMLKYEGLFILQVQGDGPIRMLVSDVTSAGEIRACAGFDTARLATATTQLAALETTEGNDNQLAQLLGKGYAAFTVDQGKHAERYQGIVELKGASLVDCIQHYFSQSEQILTGLKIAVGLRDGKWRAGGVMLQHMPEQGGYVATPAPASNVGEDDWRRAMVLLGSCSDEELLDPDLSPQDLLIRLFHEEGVRVYESQNLSKGCRCTDDKLADILLMMPDEDRADMVVDEKITMTCEYCSRDFVFDPKQIDKSRAARRD